MINLYKNYKATGQWDKNDVSSQKSIIALATALANKCAKNKSNKGNNTGKPKGGGGNSHPDLPPWRVKRSSPKFTCPDGDKWVWCKHHDRKDEHGNQHGMYMPKGHEHESWAVTKAAKQAALKPNMKEFKAAKRSGSKIEKTGKKLKSDGRKNNLSSFASTFTTKAQMFDAEAADIINSVMKENIGDDDDNDSSKD